MSDTHPAIITVTRTRYYVMCSNCAMHSDGMYSPEDAFERAQMDGWDCGPDTAIAFCSEECLQEWEAEQEAAFS